MSARLPPGFHALGLVHDATRSDVRRAYAARLKQINPDIDRIAFEELRAAYEAALRFVEQARAATAPPEFTEDKPPAMPPGAEGAIREAHTARLEESADKTSQKATCAAIEALTARIRGEDADGNEVMRIFAVLRDPVLSDPLVARAVEHEIYRFFFERIGEAADHMPEFRFTQSDQPFFKADHDAVGRLLRRLDRLFGWQSDGVRMAREFSGYDTFLVAARMVQAPVAQIVPTQSQSSGRGVTVWIAMTLIIGLLRIVSSYWNEPERPSHSPPSMLSEYAGEIGEDDAFLWALAGPPEPSTGTRMFLANLAREQHLRGETTSDVKMLVLRNTLVRLHNGRVAPDEFAAYSNPEELQYLLGVFLAARVEMRKGFAYRDISQFQFATTAGSDMALWSKAQDEVPDQGLWGTGGYVIERGPDDVPQTAYVAVYPPEFLAAMRGAANGNARALEGALGLSFRFFENHPDARVLYYPEVPFPRVNDAPVSLQRHGLVRAGLGENRWPIRAMLPSVQPCEWSASELLDPVKSWSCEGPAPRQ